MALARVDVKIGAFPVYPFPSGHFWVEAVLANANCLLQGGVMEHVKLIDVRAHFRATTASFVFSSAALFIAS